MAYEIYQSRFTGAKIDENLGKISSIEEDVSDLKREYDASKVKMADGETLPNYLANGNFKIEVSKEDNNILQKKDDGYYVAETAAYELPKATTAALGGVKVDGTTITIDDNGVISGASSLNNQDTLDKLSTSENGVLLFNNNRVTAPYTPSLSDSSRQSIVSEIIDLGAISGVYSLYLYHTTGVGYGKIWLYDENGTRITNNLNIISYDNISQPRNIEIVFKGSTTIGPYGSTNKRTVNGTSYNYHHYVFQTDVPVSKISVGGYDNTSVGVSGIQLYSENDEELITSDFFTVVTTQMHDTIIPQGSLNFISKYKKKEDILSIGEYINLTKIVADNINNDDSGTEINSISDINDVDIVSVQNGQALIWNGSNWTNGNVASGDDESSIIEGNLYYSYGKYSKNEICIGEYLGKPLYRKIYTNIQIPKATQTGTVVHTSFDSGVSVDALISINCKWYLSSGNYTFGNEYQAPSANNGAYYDFSSNKIFLANSNTGWNNAIGTIIIEYTKKSDSENSFSPSMVTNNVRIASAPCYEDYSGEEIVVGKWIDGRPVYRKSMSVKGPQVTTDGTAVSVDVPILPSTFKTLIRTYGMYGGVPINYYATDKYRTWCYQSGTNIVFNANNKVWNNYKLNISVEYTKSTDEENSFRPEMIKNDILIDEVTESDVADVLSVLGG